MSGFLITDHNVLEVAVQGFLPNGKKWANVLHMLCDPLVGAPTTGTLATALAAKYSAAIAGVLCTTTTIKEIGCRQIIDMHPDWGSYYRFTMTEVAGVITACTVNDGGSGYVDGTRDLPIWDSTGTGAVISGTFVGGSLTSCGPISGGSGYSGPVSTKELPNGVFPTINRHEWTVASVDSQVVNEAGTVTSDPLPNFNAISVRLRSSAPGRAGRSSAHLPGVPEANTTANELTTMALATAVPNLTTLYGGTTVDSTTSTYRFGTYSKEFLARTQPKGMVPTISPWWSPIASVMVNTYVGSMVRRKVHA